MSKLTKFVVFCNRMIGEAVPAKDFIDLEKRMLQRQKKFWSHIEYKDEEGRRIQISREYLENMELQEVIQDWIDYANEEELTEEIMITRY